MSRATAAAEEMSLQVDDMEKLFDEELPLALVKHRQEAQQIGAKFQLNVTGAGEWNVDLTPSGPSCVRGVGPADCTVTISEDDFRALLASPKTMTVFLFLRGRLKLDGDRVTAMKLNKLFSFK
jgi:putative sterol carrier protein